MASETTKEWYVVQTKHKHEPLVALKLGELRAESFLPRMFVTVRAGRYRQRRAEPMFPGYVFVNVDLACDAMRIRYTPGVRDFLRSEGAPCPVSSEIVDTLRIRIGSAGVYEPPVRHFEPGARLRIDDGPLRGLEAIFERELSGSERVAIFLSAINLPARVILSPDCLVRA